MIRHWGFCVGAMLAAAAAPALAQTAPLPQPQGYVMPDTDAWQIKAEDGQVYRIFVSRPKGPAPNEGFPILYVLDGNAMFAGFAEARRIQEGTGPFSDSDIGNSIIVGIGYPTDFPYDARRGYDFTSPVKAPDSAGALAKAKTGGNDSFAAFILNALRPEIARRYKVNPARQALYGHSLGGLFALHMFYTHPTAFNAIVAASPSQWWGDQSILAEERAFAGKLAAGEIRPPMARLLLLAGSLEERKDNIWDAEALAKRLDPLSAYGLRSRFELLEGERHIQVPHRSITTALRFVFSRP